QLQPAGALETAVALAEEGVDHEIAAAETLGLDDHQILFAVAVEIEEDGLYREPAVALGLEGERRRLPRAAAVRIERKQPEALLRKDPDLLRVGGDRDQHRPAVERHVPEAVHILAARELGPRFGPLAVGAEEDRAQAELAVVLGSDGLERLAA